MPSTDKIDEEATPFDGNSLTGINYRRIEALTERAQAVKDHESNLRRLDATLDDCKRREAILTADLDLGRIDRARKLIAAGSLWPARWDGQRYSLDARDLATEPSPSRLAVVQSAIDDLATATDRLKREFFGLKNYEGFSNQRTDCQYGYGPRHGSIIFRVGLTDAAREYRGFTNAERDDAIYYLRNLARIQKAEGEAIKSAA